MAHKEPQLLRRRLKMPLKRKTMMKQEACKHPVLLLPLEDFQEILGAPAASGAGGKKTTQKHLQKRFVLQAGNFVSMLAFARVDGYLVDAVRVQHDEFLVVLLRL
ncbi:hypothetical protein B0H19DRAFT_1266918 [Mycena capillaripes]|nr:hypothetical protein B0H19DRAFT_1266918 [Mycena capillaripes]